MLVRFALPLLASLALLFVGPSAQGELDLSPPPSVVELATLDSSAAAPEPMSLLDCNRHLEDELVSDRLAALDRGLPGLH
jgi:hypothetical protein